MAAERNQVGLAQPSFKSPDLSSCQYLWTCLPEGFGSGDGIASEEFDTEEFADGDDLAATAAFTTDAFVSAPQVAGVASPLAEQAFLTTRTLIDRQANQMVVAPQLVTEVGERGPAVRPAVAVAESELLLPAARRAETAAAVGLELDAAHRASRQGLAIVTRIVTHGVCAHAATAPARSAARASSSRS